jgi:16S rRNA C1402 (ribose-2'-O) methylase RsmI
MAKKQSESQDAVATLFEHIASAIEKDRGLFLGEELTAAEAKVAVSQALSVARDFRKRASQNRSIDS